jgi:hypothetical protein
MNFGAGMAAGMGAGMGAGIAVGIGSGQETARKKIREYARVHEITLHDKAGKPILWDDFLHEATGCGPAGGTKAWVLAILLGLTLFAVAAALFLWRFMG